MLGVDELALRTIGAVVVDATASVRSDRVVRVNLLERVHESLTSPGVRTLIETLPQTAAAYERPNLKTKARLGKIWDTVEQPAWASPVEGTEAEGRPVETRRRAL
jgi:hypothetical protein